MKGAEATVSMIRTSQRSWLPLLHDNNSKIKIIGRAAVLKSRTPKNYRVRELDKKLRIERTRNEARLLNKAKLAGVNCPTVLEVSDFDITMSYVDGQRPSMDKKEAIEAGKILARLHMADIIHGDYTPANLIVSNKKIFVIDFGLGYISKDIEDKAVDVFTMLRSFGNNKIAKESFLSAYHKYSKAN